MVESLSTGPWAPGNGVALVKLYQVTGKKLYLEMAEKFLEIRGKTYVPDGEGVMSPTYAQQHAPVEDQSEAVGHAVRATYLYSAMADIAGLKQKESYTKALHRIWANIQILECIYRWLGCGPWHRRIRAPISSSQRRCI